MPNRSQARTGKPEHDVDAGGRADQRHRPDERNAERARPIRAPCSAARARRCRRSRTPTAFRCSSDRRSRSRRRPAHPSATTIPVMQRRDVRNARLRMDLRRPPRQQAVARHREEDPRLAVLEHEQHRGQRDHRAKRHDPARRLQARERRAPWRADRPPCSCWYGTMPVATMPTIT